MPTHAYIYTRYARICICIQHQKATPQDTTYSLVQQIDLLQPLLRLLPFQSRVLTTSVRHMTLEILIPPSTQYEGFAMGPDLEFRRYGIYITLKTHFSPFY